MLASLAAWARGQTALRALDEHAAQRGEGAEGAEGGEGALWQAVLRTAPSAQVGGVERGGVDVQLDLVTAGAPSAAALAALKALAASLLAAHPPLARVLHTVATRPPPPDSGSARGGEGRGGAGGRGGGGRGGRRQRRSPDATRGRGPVAEPVSVVIAARGGGEGAHLRALVARPGGGAALRFEVAPRGFWQVRVG